jgi:hypothetical protein
LKNIFVISALALCAIGTSRPAQAQIHTWVDKDGVMSLSNSARNSPLRTLGASPAVTARVGGPLPLGVGGTYEPMIQQHATQQGIRAALVRAVIQVESAFNPRALSPKGAMGLMQLMPSTAATFGVIDPFNPAENIRAGVRYLRQLLDRYNDNEQLALAAYNAGPGAVDKYGSKVPPYKETQNYVKKISGIQGAATAAAPGRRIYKVDDGESVPSYSNKKPASGKYEEVVK